MFPQQKKICITQEDCCQEDWFEEDCHQEDVTKAETSNKKNAATDQQWRIVTFRAPDRADK